MSIFHEIQETKRSLPLNKYNIPELEKTHKKNRYTIIEKNITRFKPLEKNDKPSPSTYKTEVAFKH